MSTDTPPASPLTRLAESLRAIHLPRSLGEDAGTCCTECGVSFPCPTLSALAECEPHPDVPPPPTPADLVLHPAGLTIRASLAPAIAADSWLRDPAYDEFRRGYAYACLSTRAIPALSRLTPEETYWVWWAVHHGARRVFPVPALSPEPAPEPATGL